MPPVTAIVPLFDQLLEASESVSPFDTVMVPWLVKLPLPWMVKLPPLRPALIVPALTIPLPSARCWRCSAPRRCRRG